MALEGELYRRLEEIRRQTMARVAELLGEGGPSNGEEELALKAFMERMGGRGEENGTGRDL